MKLLALDTATERCSVALLCDGHCSVREIVTPRGHAELILPMVDELLREGSMRLRDLDAIAYGRGPGAFTGVRIAVSVVQGLAYGAVKPVVGVSDLAAVAQASTSVGQILVCMDARMGEVYWCTYRRDLQGFVQPTGPERLSHPEQVDIEATALAAAVGTGFGAYENLAHRYQSVALSPQALPHAREIALLAEPEVRAGRTCSAVAALPVYLRDRVVAIP
jgi:tRNA threonylcarbamoyladenosine biosynthesis protein TsaB